MPNFTELSIGCMDKILNNEKFERPVLQILGAKKIAGAAGAERYRLLVSDGKYLNSFAMLGTQLNDEYAKGKFVDYTIVRVERYITSTVNKSEKDKRVLILLELTVLHHGSEVGEKIGNPTSYTPETARVNNGTANSTSTSNFGGSGTGMQNGTSTIVRQPTLGTTSNSMYSNTNVSLGNDSINHAYTLPIVSLSPYQNKWVIKARVTSKSPIRTWSNAKGEGKLFSMDLMDESGQIRATAFRDQCDKYYNMIEVDKVYYFSKCQLKPANKQYTTINNDYEMAFTSETVVQMCDDDEEGVPQVKYDFVSISQIANIEPKAVVDVLGVCKDVTDLQVFTGKTNNREFKKRDLTLVDMSDSSVQVTIWGDDAVNFEGHVQPVVLVKGGRVTEFGGGKSISLGVGASLKINPDITEAHKLRAWFDKGGAENISNSVSSRVSGASAISTEWMTFHEARMRNLGSGDKPDYFQCKAAIHMVRSSNSTYKACPQPDCNKKVVDEQNGYYRCEKCCQSFPNFKYRLLVNMSIGDWTTNRWATCFSEIAETILGKSAQDIGYLIDQKSSEAEEYFSAIHFKEFIFKLRSKVELYGDSYRNKLTIMNASPINHKEYNNYLIKNLQQLTGIGKK